MLMNQPKFFFDRRVCQQRQCWRLLKSHYILNCSSRSLYWTLTGTSDFSAASWERVRYWSILYRAVRKSQSLLSEAPKKGEHNYSVSLILDSSRQEPFLYERHLPQKYGGFSFGTKCNSFAFGIPSCQVLFCDDIKVWNSIELFWTNVFVHHNIISTWQWMLNRYHSFSWH